MISGCLRLEAAGRKAEAAERKAEEEARRRAVRKAAAARSSAEAEEEAAKSARMLAQAREDAEAAQRLLVRARVDVEAAQMAQEVVWDRSPFRVGLHMCASDCVEPLLCEASKFRYPEYGFKLAPGSSRGERFAASFARVPNPTAKLGLGVGVLKGVEGNWSA